MRRMLFVAAATAVIAPSVPLAAQAVPGRDLLAYPVGTAADAPVLATASGDGLWNPAASLLPSHHRWRAGAAAVNTPSAQGLEVQALWGGVAIPGPVTLAFSVVRASVRDIARTEADPTPLGDVVYGTTLGSLGAAARLSGFVVGGAALRYRLGELDGERRSAIGVDGGVLAGGGWWRDLRAGASTVLWRPGGSADESSYSAGADLRVLGRDSVVQLRAGYAGTAYGGGGEDHYGFVAAHSGGFVARGGVLAVRAFGATERRARLGLGLVFATYYVSLACETGAATRAPAYLFTLATTGP